jgi:hypothetical protein
MTFSFKIILLKLRASVAVYARDRKLHRNRQSTGQRNLRRKRPAQAAKSLPALVNFRQRVTSTTIPKECRLQFFTERRHTIMVVQNEPAHEPIAQRFLQLAQSSKSPVGVPWQKPLLRFQW